MVGDAACRAYLTGMFSDWQAPGISVVLHEKRGGYANNVASLTGLAAKAEAAGVTIRAGVRVTGVALEGGAVTAVQTEQGDIGCDQLVVAAGPWIRDLWAMLELPDRIAVTGSGRDGRIPTIRCGPTGRCRRAPSRSTRTSSATTTAGSRRCCTSTPTSRCSTTSTAA